MMDSESCPCTGEETLRQIDFTCTRGQKIVDEAADHYRPRTDHQINLAPS